MKNLFKKVVLSGLALSAASIAPAASNSGSTDFRVTLPEILVLYHWDDAHLKLTDITTTPANDSDAHEISDTTTHDLLAPLANGSYTLTGDVDTKTSPMASLDGGKIDVTLQNSWAVRSLSSGTVTLGLTTQEDTLMNVNDNNATVTTSDAVLASSAAGVTGSDSANLTIPSGWDPVKGDIKFKLDLSNANFAGEYNTRGVQGAASTNDEATDTFLLTLTGN